MNNLLKKRTKKYIKQSTQEEVYQQVHFYEIIVEDRAGIMKKMGDPKELMNCLFGALQDYHLNNTVMELFNHKKYSISLEISDAGNDRIAKLTITKRQLFKRLIAVFRGC